MYSRLDGLLSFRTMTPHQQQDAGYSSVKPADCCASKERNIAGTAREHPGLFPRGTRRLTRRSGKIASDLKMYNNMHISMQVIHESFSIHFTTVLTDIPHQHLLLQVAQICIYCTHFICLVIYVFGFLHARHFYVYF